MDIARWDPIKELEEVSSRLNRIFGISMPKAKDGNGNESLTVAQWTPAIDVIETDKEFTVKAELPDVKKEDIKVTAENGVLTIKGERKQEKEEKGKKFHRIERSYGSFLRSFSLPDDVDATKISAEIKDGMLNVKLPRTEKAKPKSIEVKVD